MKMRIQLDEQKIRKEGKYSFDKIVDSLDKAFEKLELYRIHDYSEILTYGGLDNSSDFAHFGVMYNRLRREKWFVENLLLWELHEPIEYFDMKLSNIENLIPKCKEFL